MRSFALVSLFLIAIISAVKSYNILMIFPIPIKSTSLLGDSLVKHLLEAGHSITHITPYPFKDAPKANLRQIDVSANSVLFAGDEYMKIDYYMTGSPNANADIYYYQEFASALAELTLKNEEVIALLQDTRVHFDVVVADLYENEAYAGVSALYNCPMIWSYSVGVSWLSLRLVDEASNPAYTVDYLSSNLPPLNFWQRVEELWTQAKWTWLKRLFTMPREEAFYKAYFEPLLRKQGRILPPYEEVIYNASFIFGNENCITERIPALPQNYKLIGGQHIRESRNSLPKEIKSAMDNSKYGVIYFSMGSTWKSKDLPQKTKKDLLTMFGQLKETVLWKYEEDDLTNIPKNVHLVRWAPQHEILAHPKCLVYVYQGGQLSSMEAVYFGVPVVGIPISFDQFRNVNRALIEGYGVKLELDWELPRKMKDAINTILTEQKYRQKAKELSTAFQDRLVSPGQEFVFWVEHVIRTRGAPHLRSPALRTPWYQKMFFDLLALLVAVAAAVIYVVLKLMRRCHTSVKHSKNKKNA